MNETTKTTEKTAKGFDFLTLALLAFGGLGMEVLYAYLLEPLLYGAEMQAWTLAQTLCHWVLTIITWGIFAALLCRRSQRRYGFDLFAEQEPMHVWQWLAAAVCVGLALVVSYMDWEGFKVVKEYHSNGALKFVFQYVYYFFETALFTLIIVFAQKAFETWFKVKNISYGGIICAVTWGIAHIFTKGSLWVGLLSALSGFAYGVVYLLLGRDIRKTYLALAVMFIL